MRPYVANAGKPLRIRKFDPESTFYSRKFKAEHTFVVFVIGNVIAPLIFRVKQIADMSGTPRCCELPFRNPKFATSFRGLRYQIFDL